MEKLDLKDRKILYHLDLNSRQSFAQLGKKVGLHKDVVAYRVNRLQEKGIIVRFNTLVDELKMGFTELRFYFNYQYITPEIKNEIINHFARFKHTEVVNTNEGSIDQTVFMLAKNVSEIYSFWQKTLGKYSDYLAKQKISVYMGEIIYPKSFLIDKKDDRTSHIIRGGIPAEYDELDNLILQMLAQNARTPTIEIAKKLNRTTNTINKRVKKLIISGLILRFTVTIDWEKIGYKWFKADLYLKDYNKVHQLMKYIEKNPHLAYIDKTLGHADLELELIVKDVTQLNKIIEDIYIKFPKIIRSYSYFKVVKSHKWINVPVAIANPYF
jgi:DNA-binding Lrp family transcriptional regulator